MIKFMMDHITDIPGEIPDSINDADDGLLLQERDIFDQNKVRLTCLRNLKRLIVLDMI
jgi:hypothetical protein